MVLQLSEYSAWTLPKRFDEPRNNQDAADADCNKMNFAIADGFSNGSFASKLWAQLLVASYVLTSQLNERTLAIARMQFRIDVNENSLRGFRRLKYLQGSYATFVGVKIWLASEYIDVHAIGDSVFMLFDDNEMVVSFPNEKLTKHPVFISSRDDKNRDKSGQHVLMNHDYKYFDNLSDISNPVIYLMTDKIAEWVLAHKEMQSVINMISSEDDFRDFVTLARDQQGLPMDDTTVMRIRLERV